MITKLKKIVRRADDLLARQAAKVKSDGPGLLILTFHGTFAKESDAYSGSVDPQQAITLAHVHEVIERMLESNYSFVGPDAVPYLEPSRHWAMLSFDDGCATNLSLLPILEEYKIPAAFFICTGHTEHQRAFWWDVVYRERMKRGGNAAAIAVEQQSIKSKTTAEIDNYLVQEFGADSLHVQGDLDRAMTVDELKQFARSPLVRVGNHTRDHAILTAHSPEQATEQLVESQKSLESWLGIRPTALAYPNGNSNPATRALARSLGFSQGQTVRTGKSTLPAKDLMMLPRVTIWGQRPIADQLESAKSGVSMVQALRRR